MTQLSNPVGRVGGSNITDTIRPAVSLLTSTQNAVGTLFSLWHGSRFNEAVSAEDAQTLYEALAHDKTDTVDWSDSKETNERLQKVVDYIKSSYPEHAVSGVSHTIKQVAKMNLIANVPSAEAVHFTFCIDNASVALREQMVRSKLASYWTQTSRTANLTAMDVNMSDRIEFYGGEEATDVYKGAVQSIRDAYIKLHELGVPVEEIRLAPEARTHRVYWMISARALLPIISKRLDWMAQATLWSPIIADVCDILRKVDPMFAEFFGKPEVKVAEGKISFHKYDNENEDRYYQRDPQPIDPLWLSYHQLVMPEHTDLKFYDDMKSLFIKLWDDELLSVLGWDRSNPAKIGPYDRPASWYKENGVPEMIAHLETEYTPE